MEIGRLQREGTGLPARLLFPTSRADLRVSWHTGRDAFVLSLWHGEECVGTAPLGPAEAAEVAAFITTHLGARPAAGPHLVTGELQPRRGVPLREWRDRLGTVLRGR